MTGSFCAARSAVVQWRSRFGPDSVSSARGTPLWADCNAQMGEDAEVPTDWDLAVQPARGAPHAPAATGQFLFMDLAPTNA